MDEVIAGLDQLIMLVLLRQHPQGYGVSVKEALKVDTGRDYSIGSIYSGLERLARRGYVKARQGEPEAKRGGRGKLFYELTGRGRSVLIMSFQATDRLRKGLDLAAEPAVLCGVPT